MLLNNSKSHDEECTTIEDNLRRNVVYQNYPTDCLAKLITKKSLLLFLPVLIPILVFFVYIILGFFVVDYTVEEFQLRKDIKVRESAYIYAETLESHVSHLSGASSFQNLINAKKNRSQVRGSLRMVSVVDLSRLHYFCKTNKLNCDGLDNILHPSNLHYVTSLERNIAAFESFGEVCFTNALEYGRVNDFIPHCVPPTGLLQYVLPSWNKTEGKWHMDGRGDELQVDYLPRLFMNPNYGWFLDANFSTLNQKASHVRTEFTLASSSSETLKKYKQKLRYFVLDALSYVKKAEHEYIWTFIGGDLVESLKAEESIFGEYVRLVLVPLICLTLCWVHSGSLLIGLYSTFQLAVTHAAACWVYFIIYNKLSIVLFSASVWVMTFCLHGTLGFYDTFVYSGVMLTNSRRNDLSLEQRVSFTMRRVTISVCVSNIFAIVLFLINLKSVSESLQNFSVFMTIALLWNMHFITCITPAFFMFYHYYVSNRGRRLQVQVDLLNKKTRSCKRALCMSTLLIAAQSKAVAKQKRNLERDQALCDTNASNANNNDNEHHQMRFHAKSQEVWSTFLDKLQSIREDLHNMFHIPYCKVRQFVMKKKQDSPNREVLEKTCTTEDIVSKDKSVDSHVGPKSQYYNRRMLLYADVVHVPREYTERSKECWRMISAAMTQHGSVEEPRVSPLPNCSYYISSDVRTFVRSWNAIAEYLGVKTQVLSSVTSLLPLVARSVVRAQDTRYIILNSGEPASGDTEEKSSAEHDPKEHANSMGFFTRFSFFLEKLLRLTPKNRENNEDPPKTLLKGRTRWKIDANPRYKRRFTLFERFIFSIYVPFLHRIRWFVLLMFILLVTVACVFGLRIEVTGLPTTLVNERKGSFESFAKLDDVFGQRGKCTFCGPYYSPPDVYRTATAMDVELCKTMYKNPQMNVYVDRCNVCGGKDECIDCANEPRGSHVLQCGGCELLNESSCSPSRAHSGTYCEWNRGKRNFFGYNCSVECNSKTCGSKGECDMYTGVCVCKEGFAGAKCDKCAEWLLPIESNTYCIMECSAAYNSNECACDLSMGRCTKCPKGRRGYRCDSLNHDCPPRMVYDEIKDACVCGSHWTGPTCNVSERCNMRGAWVDAKESPTMTETCICAGHWRGPTCQLCDCLNGGMCDAETGKCICKGTFVGKRCQTCSADCIKHGACPTVPISELNMRTCIYNICSTDDIAHESPCGKCDSTLAFSKTCAQYTNETDCNLQPVCWWKTNQCYGTGLVDKSSNATDCICLNPLLWSGKNCEKCLAPPGATCVGNDFLRGCNGQQYLLPSHTMSMDQCGICGGDGRCRGCDGIPNSGTTYDKCGVCGGNNDCDREEDNRPFFVNYLIDFTDVTNITELNMSKYVLPFCSSVRDQFTRTKISPCFMEDYLRGSDHQDTILSLEDVYNYAVINGRMSEVIFEMDSDSKPKALTHMIYRLSLSSLRTAYKNNETISYASLAEPKSIFDLYDTLQKRIDKVFKPLLTEVNTSILVTSLPFQSAAFFVYSTHVLSVTVIMGVIVCFLAFLILTASMTISLSGAMVVTMVGFGTLMACNLFHLKLDTMLQMCLSSTIPISMEYVVHIAGEYTDYLQSTTSNLFASGVSRKTALTASMLQSLPSFCTSLLAVMSASFIFSTSDLIPSRRSGQVCMAMHVVLLLAVTLFSGTLLAVGPRKSFQHWTVSVALALFILPLCIMVVVLCYHYKSYF